MESGSPFAPTGPLLGTVERFDTHSCLGEVVDAAGRTWPFQCTALVDGTREVAPGTEVTFVVVPRNGGRLEADRLVTR
ncbi:MAG: hypothetical protein R2754_04715 [Microthrixaceae bacterium]